MSQCLLLSEPLRPLPSRCLTGCHDRWGCRIRTYVIGCIRTHDDEVSPAPPTVPFLRLHQPTDSPCCISKELLCIATLVYAVILLICILGVFRSVDSASSALAMHLKDEGRRLCRSAFGSLAMLGRLDPDMWAALAAPQANHVHQRQSVAGKRCANVHVEK